MQINYLNALVLALMFTLQCNGMDKETKQRKKQAELARAKARYYKQQNYNDSKFGHYEDMAQRSITQREAKRNLKNK